MERCDVAELLRLWILSRKVVGSSPGRSIALCPWTRHFTLIVSVYPAVNGHLAQAGGIGWSSGLVATLKATVSVWCKTRSRSAVASFINLAS